MIKENIRDAEQGKQIGWYSGVEEKNILKALRKYSVKGKKGLVIGSEKPWVEALALMAEVEHLTTIEYGKIISSIPEISTLTPPEAAELFLSGKFELADFVISFSSIEHSGLGRYGDSLNPYGDLEATAQVWCMLKPGGYFFIGVMTSDRCFLEYNAHRYYGPQRYKHLATNFEQIEKVDDYGVLQPVFVLRKQMN